MTTKNVYKLVATSYTVPMMTSAKDLRAGMKVEWDGRVRTIRSAAKTGGGTVTVLLEKLPGDVRPPLVMVGGHSSVKALDVVA